MYLLRHPKMSDYADPGIEGLTCSVQLGLHPRLVPVSSWRIGPGAA
ncbi:MAG: hypothetical protein AAEJ53_10275 [Myxococcota bacterium]